MAFRCQDFPNPVHASLGPSFVRMMSHPCSGNVYSSWLLPRPSAQQPSTLQHALFPGRDPIRWGVEETAGVGEWHEKTRSSYPSCIPPVYPPSPASRRTYVPGTGTNLGIFMYISSNPHISPLRHIPFFPDVQIGKLQFGEGKLLNKGHPGGSTGMPV